MWHKDHVNEDWSNDAENAVLITEINFILTYIKIENRYIYDIITILLILLYFDQINATLVKPKWL